MEIEIGELKKSLEQEGKNNQTKLIEEKAFLEASNMKLENDIILLNKELGGKKEISDSSSMKNVPSQNS